MLVHVKEACSCAGRPSCFCSSIVRHTCALSCRLPQKRVLTLNLELPESWLVEPVMALHDLDNLRLADIPEQVRRWAGFCLHWGG